MSQDLVEHYKRLLQQNDQPSSHRRLSTAEAADDYSIREFYQLIDNFLRSDRDDNAKVRRRP